MAFDSVLYARATVPNERRHGLAERGDYDTQPRLLQPVAQDTPGHPLALTDDL